MIAPAASPDEQIRTQFTELMPNLTRYLHRRLAGNRPEAREEMVAEGVALAWTNYLSASRRGKELTAGNLAWSAAQNVLSGRRLAGTCSTDALADGRRGPSLDCAVASLERGGRGFYHVWADKRWRWPIVDYVAPKLDWADFYNRLSKRDRRLLRLKVSGMQQTEIAKLLAITPARVCQRISELRNQWQQRGIV